jgi:hypothetical protein
MPPGRRPSGRGGVEFAGIFVFVLVDGLWLIDDRQRIDAGTEATQAGSR